MIHQGDSNRKAAFIVFLIFLFLAFIQCYKAAAGSSWGYDIDNYRDMANIETILAGNYGQDPSYIGEYWWFNPLIFWIEAWLVKITHLPVLVVLTRSGILLNIFGPICFFFMMRKLFNSSIAIAALTGFLFFTANDLPGWAVATYSPWVFAATFTQAIFYLNIIVLYNCCKTEKVSSFVLFGITTGICFLSHTAPTLISILIMLIITIEKFIDCLKQKNYNELFKLIRYRMVAALLFIIASLPLTYYIIGKYNLNMVNTITYEYTHPLFPLYKTWILIKMNLSVSLIVAFIGFIYFLFRFPYGLNRKIILYFFLICIGMYMHSSAVAFIAAKYNIHLFGTVPMHHYFYYLKTVQAIMFGFGLYFIFFEGLPWVVKKVNLTFLKNILSYKNSFIAGLIIIVLINYPSYSNRKDFHEIDSMVVNMNKDPWRFEAYSWIKANSDINDVFLCARDLTDVPVLAAGRKMVAVSLTFSNAYLDYNKRHADRDFLLQSLRSGKDSLAENLLDQYKVKFLLLRNNQVDSSSYINSYFSELVYRNSGLSIYKRNL